MSRINPLKWPRVANVVVCAWVLSSCGGSGGNSSPGAASAHAYVLNGGTLTTYSINPSTAGLEASVGTPLVFPDNFDLGDVRQIAADPSGQFLYLLHFSGVHVYAIDRSSGALTALAGSPFPAGGAPNSLAFDASGNYLYVAANTGPPSPYNTLISTYSVDSSGALTGPLAKYAVGEESSTIVTAGNHLYVAGFYSNSITAFSIGPAGELLQNVPGSPFATDTGPFAIVANPSGSVLYTANDGAPTATDPTPGSISAFTIDSSTGALTPVPGNPQPIAVQAEVSIDPMGKFLFAPEANGVSVYAINTATGELSAVAGSPFSAGTRPGPASVDPAGKVVYVVNGGSANVSEFTLESTGALKPLAGSPQPVGSNPTSITVVQ
jgi:6-phosphogluconolactonase